MANDQKKLISLIASIVMACFLALIALIGFLGKNSFTPKIIDSLFGITEYVSQQITKHIDSGYSRTFIFAPGFPPEDKPLLFFAEQGQSVELTLMANGPNSLTFRAFIDGQPWGGPLSFPYQIHQGSITDKLLFNIPPGKGVHFLKIQPENLKPDSTVVVECLVMVYVNGGKKR